MGPRLFSRGNIVMIWQKTRATLIGFNGATTFQPWKCVARSTMMVSRRASMGPRLFSRGNGAGRRAWAPLGQWLQWGHDFSAVEMTWAIE